jgi:ubiquitin-conjugating enzyme E2 W
VEGNDLKEWLFDIRVLDSNPIYDGNIFRLKFVFSDTYPIGK